MFLTGFLHRSADSNNNMHKNRKGKKMKLKNERGNFSSRLLIAVIAICIIISSICMRIHITSKEHNITESAAYASEEPQTVKLDIQETIGQSAETREINALLKKAEKYAKKAEEEYKIAEGSWTAENKAYGSQPAIYFTLKTICTQNEVIIKLLREKVDR